MPNNPQLAKIVKIIRQYNNFLITAHIHPEGDAICSQLALLNLLKRMKKHVVIYNHDSVPDNLTFFKETRYIHTAVPRLTPEVVIVLDSPNLSRVGKVADYIRDKFIINIDHHISNAYFGRINWVDRHASSASEMIYLLIKRMHPVIDPQTAKLLYVGIMTDTGSFRYTNTSAYTHTIAAELINCKISVEDIYKNIYLNKTPPQIRLTAQVLLNLKRACHGKLVWSKITKNMLCHKGKNIAVPEDLIENIRQLQGTEVVVLFREMENNRIKVSMRSQAKVDVNKIAGFFKGGGHRLASGCVISGSMDKVMRKVLAKVKQQAALVKRS
ncbi:MAG: bifunctional oligoribonuclease/PAP phosphatase NrnA [Candidatus Omnitrophota bacterium]